MQILRSVLKVNKRSSYVDVGFTTITGTWLAWDQMKAGYNGIAGEAQPTLNFQGHQAYWDDDEGKYDENGVYEYIHNLGLISYEADLLHTLHNHPNYGILFPNVYDQLWIPLGDTQYPAFVMDYLYEIEELTAALLASMDPAQKKNVFINLCEGMQVLRHHKLSNTDIEAVWAKKIPTQANKALYFLDVERLSYLDHYKSFVGQANAYDELDVKFGEPANVLQSWVEEWAGAYDERKAARQAMKIELEVDLDSGEEDSSTSS